MNLDLTGKTALVCGSTQGIGYASAIELAKLGASVILMARNEEKLKTSLATLNSSGLNQKHIYLVADFSSAAQVKSTIDKYISEGNHIHILVNNTGGPSGGPALDAEMKDFVQAFESHLLCNQVLAQAIVPGMKEAGFGRIVNIISTSVKSPLKGLGVSNTIRAAVANWSKTLSVELAPHGITVNNILPGLTETERAKYIINNKVEKTGKTEKEVISEMLVEIPAGRMAKAEELGAAVAFLCSPAAGYINGINLPVDGGRLSCL